MSWFISNYLSTPRNRKFLETHNRQSKTQNTAVKRLHVYRCCKNRWGASRLSEPSCLTRAKKNQKRQSVMYLVSEPYNYFGRPQNRKVNQQETKILKFSLSLLLFPFPDFRWMFQFSFSYFARQRSCFSFSREKLVRSRSELIPLRMPKGWPLFSFASVLRISQGGT